MSTSKQTARTLAGTLRRLTDKVFKHYFDDLLDRLSEVVKRTGGQAEEEARKVVRDETATVLARLEGLAGALTLARERVESLERSLERELGDMASDVTTPVIVDIDETRGALQRQLTSAVDEVRGTVESFRDVFEDFRAKVEPRVVSLEARLDTLELRIMTLESEQKDYEDMRSRDMRAVQDASASLRDELRSDVVEMTRMLRMQGDAQDQVAEALGRTIARLSAELDLLAESIDGIRSEEGAHQPV